MGLRETSDFNYQICLRNLPLTQTEQAERAMNTVKNIVNKVKGKPAQQTAVCNYADNYYGDRVCVLVKAG